MLVSRQRGNGVELNLGHIINSAPIHVTLGYHEHLRILRRSLEAGTGNPGKVNRLGLSRTRVLGPRERITPEEAFCAVTIDAAYAMGRENEMGSIDIGKKANFTIFDQNPLTIDPGKLKDVGITATVFEGKVYPIDNGGKVQVNLSEKTAKVLLAYHADNHGHGDACIANQILQEGFKKMKSIQ